MEILKLGERRYLRSGASYHASWEVHKGLLFDNGKPKYPICKLGDIIVPHKTEILKKGPLSKEYILLDLEDLEPLTGRILNEEKIVDEIGSDKVVFGNCDIVISKIDPYLAYVFINDKEKPLIGTTELLPFKLKNNIVVSLEYLKYLLLTNEYIIKSGLLMYGKRHPRIHPNDLLNIKVPIPDIKIQEKIVEEIKIEETKSFEYRKEIKRLRKQIDKVIYEAIANG
jgi:restriction endonuclease S subunit